MEWISVKDKLPKEEYKTNSMGSYYFSEKLLVKQGKRKIKCWFKPRNGRFYSVAGANEVVNITHWMPLPEPPPNALKSIK